MTSQLQLTLCCWLCENHSRPFGLFSFAGWHHVKLCQWMVLERQCKEEGVFPSWFWCAPGRWPGSCRAQGPVASPHTPPGASRETSLHKWLSLASQRVDFEKCEGFQQVPPWQHHPDSLSLSEPRLCPLPPSGSQPWRSSSAGRVVAGPRICYFCVLESSVHFSLANLSLRQSTVTVNNSLHSTFSVQITV